MNGVVVRRGSTVLDSKTLFHCEFLKVYMQYMKYHEKQPSCCIRFQFYPANSQTFCMTQMTTQKLVAISPLQDMLSDLGFCSPAIQSVSRICAVCCIPCTRCWCSVRKFSRKYPFGKDTVNRTSVSQYHGQHSWTGKYVIIRGLSAGIVITKETKEPNNRVLLGS